MKQVASMLTVGFQCRFKTLEVTNNGHQSILYVDEERANPRYHVILIVTRNEKTKTQSSNQSHIYVVNQISYVDMLMLMLPSTTPSFHLRPESGAVPLQAAHTFALRATRFHNLQITRCTKSWRPKTNPPIPNLKTRTMTPMKMKTSTQKPPQQQTTMSPRPPTRTKKARPLLKLRTRSQKANPQNDQRP
jgi:hypothetical protein